MLRRTLSLVLVFLIVVGLGWVVVHYYSYLFSKVVRGKIERVERVDLGTAVIQTAPAGTPRDQLFSFAIAIRDEKSNEIFTASSEDRQWAVVQTGQCAEARLYPYPPWNLEKSGTFGNARLEKLFDCVPDVKK
jgi:hypothetical protein